MDEGSPLLLMHGGLGEAFPDAGHAPWIDQPDQVVVAINEALGRSVG